MRNEPIRGILFDAIAACILSVRGEKIDLPTTLPGIVVPFFLASDDRDAPILSFFKEHIHSVDGWEALTILLGEDENRDRLRVLVYEALFGSDAQAADSFVCSMKTAALLDETSFSAEFKYQALLCLTYFRHGVSELCRILQSALEWAAILHEGAESETDALFSAMRSGKYDTLYRASAGLDFSGSREITVSFSILRPEIVLPVSEGKKLILIVGKDHADALVRAMDEESIDVGAFLDDLGNELRRMILDALSAEEDMTASDISRLTGIPVTTVLRHMEALTDHYLIRVSGRKGMQIFYTLNREYLEKAHRKTDKYMRSLYGGDLIEKRNQN